LKPSNKDAATAASAERVEGRRLAKGNANQPAALRTQSRASVSIGLRGVREAARRDRRARFTTLMHHVTVDRLRASFMALKRRAAPGVDGVTWHEYEDRLGDRLEVLHRRVHVGSYRALPSKRTYIPKADGRQRPLGIAALEDKIVQHALATVLNEIYEVDFLGFSYGFRPGRGAHDALDALHMGLVTKRVSWVLDADIRGFFDTVSHEWMLKFLEHRIGDRRVLRLVAKWLRSGVLEDGHWSATRVGTPQGSVISPLLANVYLHYVFELWVAQWRRKSAQGDVIVVRYADDFALGFQYRADAVRFLEELKDRMHKFGLALHPEKTRLIEFGRFADRHRRRKGQGKPESFDFLGFTHSCGLTRTNKRFTVRRQTVARRMRAKLREIKGTLHERRHDPVAEQGAWLGAVVRGYMNYHAVPGNIRMMEAFRRECVRQWLFALRRRSQRHRMPWKRFGPLAAIWVPKPKILHPYPGQRFDARTRGRSPVR